MKFSSIRSNIFTNFHSTAKEFWKSTTSQNIVLTEIPQLLQFLSPFRHQTLIGIRKLHYQPKLLHQFLPLTNANAVVVVVVYVIQPFKLLSILSFTSDTLTCNTSISHLWVFYSYGTLRELLRWKCYSWLCLFDLTTRLSRLGIIGS